MLNIFLIFITAITVSMYYFPFAFRFMPTMVGKTIMAAIGLALILVQWARKHQAGFDKEMYMLVIGGSLVSLVSIISAIVNHTPDYTYATYLISMAVWMSAAYLVCFIIKQVHGYLSLQLLCNYLIGVCVSQCSRMYQIADKRMPSRKAYRLYQQWTVSMPAVHCHRAGS